MLTDQLERLHVLLENESLQRVSLARDGETIWLEKDGEPLHLALPINKDTESIETPRAFLRRFVKTIFSNARYAAKVDGEC